MKAADGSAKTRNNRPVSKKLLRVTISLDPDDYATFEHVGEKTHLSRSWLIRKAMREFLERSADGKGIGAL